jgi:carotenoid cleavage dioxygenase-like enzyme
MTSSKQGEARIETAATPTSAAPSQHASSPTRRTFFGLTESLPEEHDYDARIEGHILDQLHGNQLRGTLYRNGPGIFERNGHRLRCILDGDGMIQSFTFDGSAVRYCNRFVRTGKYQDESEDWLLTLVYDHGEQRSYLAVLRADHIADGPVARVWLEHHTPLSFHGNGQPA